MLIRGIGLQIRNTDLLLIVRERELLLVIQGSHLGQQGREGGEVPSLDTAGQVALKHSVSLGEW